MNSNIFRYQALPTPAELLGQAHEPQKAMWLPGYTNEPPEWQKGPILALTFGGIGGVILGILLARWKNKRARRRNPSHADTAPLAGVYWLVKGEGNRYTFWPALNHYEAAAGLLIDLDAARDVLVKLGKLKPSEAAKASPERVSIALGQIEMYEPELMGDDLRSTIAGSVHSYKKIIASEQGTRDLYGMMFERDAVRADRFMFEFGVLNKASLGAIQAFIKWQLKDVPERKWRGTVVTLDGYLPPGRTRMSGDITIEDLLAAETPAHVRQIADVSDWYRAASQH